jgi:site-specific recombinase XerD
LIDVTKGSRNEARDRCLLLLMFRHGLRVSEAVGIKLGQVDTESRVALRKYSVAASLPLLGPSSHAAL